MKDYVYLLLIYLLLLSCSSNRSLDSSKNTKILASVSENEVSKSKTDTVIQEESTAHTKETSNTKENIDKSETELQESNEYEEKNKKTTLYDRDGNVRATIESTERRGKDQSSNRTRGSTHASDTSIGRETELKANREVEINSKTETEANRHLDVDINQSKTVNEVIKTDSRPIQGIEWLYVIIAIAVVLIILYFIYKRR